MKKTKPMKTRKIKSDSTQLNSFLRVQIFAVIIYIVIFMFGAVIALSMDLSQKYDFIFTLIVFAICSLITGFYTGLKLRQNGLVSGVIYTLPINAVTILISLILCDFNVSINTLITAIVLIITSAIGGIFAVNKRLRR